MKKLSEMSISEMLESATDGMNLFIEEAEEPDLSSTNNGASGTDAAPEKENKEMDKREAIREIMAISAKPVSEFEGGEEEKVETIAKIAEKIAYKPSETGANDAECGKDEDPQKDPEEDEKKSSGKAADEEDPKKDEEAKKAKAQDTALSMDAMEKAVLERLERKSRLVEQVKPFIGTFDSALMTEKEVAVYSCDKLGLKVAEDKALDVLTGYLAGAKKPEASVVMDESLTAARNAESDPAFDKYLKEN